jgi:hypothetical protein
MQRWLINLRANEKQIRAVAVMKKPVTTSETSVYSYETAGRNFSGDSRLHEIMSDCYV